jgi:hypothetical protein
MFSDQLSPNWTGTSTRRPVSPPVVGSRWHAAHIISAVRFPRATRSGVTSTFSSIVSTG